MIIKPSFVTRPLKGEKRLLCSSPFCEVVLLVLWLLPLWFCWAIQRFYCSSSDRTLCCCLTVGRAWIARRFPWWDELEAATLLHEVDLSCKSELEAATLLHEVDLSCKSELDHRPSPLRGFVEGRCAPLEEMNGKRLDILLPSEGL